MFKPYFDHIWVLKNAKLEGVALGFVWKIYDQTKYRVILPQFSRD